MKRVLIIDDDRWFAESIGAGLKKAHYKVAIVGSTEAIFPSMEVFKPHYLILDLILGEKNAITFLNELISYDDLGGIKIIVLSSASKDVSHNNLTKLGVSEILDKVEATPEALRQTLESFR